MQLTDRDRRAIKYGGPVIGLLAIISLAVFVVGPFLDRVASSDTDSARLEQRCATLLRNADIRQKKHQEIARFEERLGPFEEPLTYDGQVTRLDKNVAEAARKAGVQLQSTRRIEAQPSRVMPNYEIGGLRTQLAAPLAQIVRFLGELQRTPGVFSVESLELSADAKNPQQVTAQIQVSTLVAPGQKKGKV